VATCLLPLCALRLFNMYALSRDIYFGTLRQYREIDVLPEPPRFDDWSTPADYFVTDGLRSGRVALVWVLPGTRVRRN
jgi:hypothetical protein